MSTESKANNILVFPKTSSTRGMAPHRVDMSRIAGRIALIFHEHGEIGDDFWDDVEMMLYENVDGLASIAQKEDKRGRGVWISFAAEGSLGLFRYEYLVLSPT